ncbi:MAG: SDR family oxidoreductase [Pseudomonadota bacterium]
MGLGGFLTQNPQKGCALITGAGGRLGRLLQAAYAQSPNHLYRFEFQSRRPGADHQWSPGDDPRALPHCEAVIGLWGATSGSPAALSQNAQLVSTTSELAQALGAKRVIHLSSAAVYGPGTSMNENHSVGHCSDYGKSKLEMEKAARKRGQTDGLTHICLRLANVVGADSLAPALQHAGPATIDSFTCDPEPPKGPLRSYISASDLLRVLDGLLALPEIEWPAILNVACPEPIFMDALIRAADKDVIWQPAPPTAVAEVTLDATYLQKLLPSLNFLSTAPALIDDWRRLESLG